MSPLATAQVVIERTAFAWGLARPAGGSNHRLGSVAEFGDTADLEVSAADDDERLIELV